MLDLNNSIRKEKSSYIFICLTEGCFAEIKSKPYYLKRHTGLCAKCSHRKPEYVHLYNKVKSSAKNENKYFDLSLSDFIILSKIDKCHYCLSDRKIEPYCYKNGKYISAYYGLDRADNSLGYTKENCVPCCTKCNIAKGNRYTYEEWFGMTKYFRDKKY